VKRGTPQTQTPPGYDPQTPPGSVVGI